MPIQKERSTYSEPIPKAVYELEFVSEPKVIIARATGKRLLPLRLKIVNMFAPTETLEMYNYCIGRTFTDFIDLDRDIDSKLQKIANQTGQETGLIMSILNNENNEVHDPIFLGKRVKAVCYSRRVQELDDFKQPIVNTDDTPVFSYAYSVAFYLS